jgi:predicted phage terminase large subunit-like protein
LGGKTFAIILNMVKFAAMQNSTIVLFRKNSTQIKSGGGVWQEAVPIFTRMFPDAKIRHRDLEIYIPSTNSYVKFSHLQHISDVYNHLGSQYSACFFDETVTFDPFEDYVLPLMGRLRNANVSYSPQMFWATNPKFDHGIYHWIKDFYLDPQTGIPLQEKSNIERYFVLQDNKPVWYDNREEAVAIHGDQVRSFRAIRAHVTENVPLMRANPDYLYNLMALPEIKRRIYLDGSWTAREEEAGYFKREFSKIIPFPNLGRCKRVRAWDQAATPVSSATPNPDWTRGVLVSKDRNTGKYTVENVKSLRDRPHEVEQLIFKTAREDLDNGVNMTTIACDPGAAGIAYATSIKVRLAEMGMHCKLMKTSKSKLTRFLPVSAIAQAGMLDFVDDDWTEEMLKELENFNGDKDNGKDDQADALSDAIAALNQGIDLPNMSYSIPNVRPSFGNVGMGSGTGLSTPAIPTSLPKLVF